MYLLKHTSKSGHSAYRSRDERNSELPCWDPFQSRAEQYTLVQVTLLVRDLLIDELDPSLPGLAIGDELSVVRLD